MTVRLNVTTATGESSEFSPGGDFTVQVKAFFEARFDVLARVDATADWEVVGTVTPHEKFGHFTDLPFVKIQMRNNSAGSEAKAWTSV